MKKKVFIILVGLLLGTFLKGQDTLKFNKYKEFPDYVTRIFKINHPELTFLKYRVFTPTLNIFDFFKGISSDSVCTPLKYLNLVRDLEVANYDTSTSINLPYIQSCMFNYVSKGVTPISISFIEYSEFKDSTFILGSIGFANNQFVENSPSGYNPFKKDRLFASSALNEVHYTPQVNFLFNDSLLLSNIPGRIDSTYIDFDDGNGFVSILKGNIYSINYLTDGVKKLKVKIKADTSYYNSSFTIVDSAASSLGNKITSGNSVSSCSTPVQLPNQLRPINAGLITGKYGIWFSTCNSAGKIRKPYIISVGFNPGDGKQLVSNHLPTFLNMILNLVTINVPLGGWGGDWRGTYYEAYNGGWNKRYSITEANQCGEGSSNGNLYLDRLRDEGYDVIILLYDNGTDYIENNAKLLKKLISDVNTEKFGNGFYFENVVSGYSAGAVSTRLALAEMEAEYKAGIGPHPHTKMWVSIEGEMQASNVPLGLQCLLDYQSNPAFLLPPLLTLNPLANAADNLNCTVASIAQSLSHNPTAFELTKYTSSFPVTNPTPARQGLLNTFSTIPGNSSNGYPEFCRRVGVAQGSSKGTNIPHSFNYFFDSQLGFNSGSGASTSVPSSCGGAYTWYMPGTGKRTTASWWNGSNSNVFDASIFIDSRFTIFPMTCININLPSYLGGGCHCLGPYNVGSYISYGNVTVSKPSVTNNWDDVPASTLSAHLEVYGKVSGGGGVSSAYPFYNSWFAGNFSFCNIDPNLHCFAPTVSTLDLHDPITGQPANNFTTPLSFNLMYNNKDLLGNPTQEPNRRYGFPYMKNPNHYLITPFDAVYAIGDNNGTDVNSKARPDNQLHVEDPQVFMGDYLARVEVAPTDLFLSNRNVGSTLNSSCTSPGCYKAEFEARNNIFVGNGIYGLNGNQNYLTPDGNFSVINNAKAILHSSNVIGLLPGTNIFSGGEADVYIQGYSCSDQLFRMSNNNNGGGRGGNSINPNTENVQQAKSVISAKKSNAVKIYPNPTSGNFSVEREAEDEAKIKISDLTGKIVFETVIKSSGINNIETHNLQNGIYMLEVGDEKFKIVISK